MSVPYIAYLYLILAACFEVSFTLCIHLSHGLTKLLPVVFAGLFMLCSVLLLAKACQHLPVSLAYSVWVGLGILGTACLQQLFFQQPLTLISWLSVLFLLGGMIGLQLSMTPQSK